MGKRIEALDQEKLQACSGYLQRTIHFEFFHMDLEISGSLASKCLTILLTVCLLVGAKQVVYSWFLEQLPAAGQKTLGEWCE